MSTALVLIDIQNDYFPGGAAELVAPEKALAHAERALKLFRSKKLPVIHVQLINTRQGASFFVPGTPGADIHPRLTPLAEESLVIKHMPNSFFQTDLEAILRKLGVEQLVVCGMMSHMCIDTSVRAAKDLGFEVILLADACTTRDLTFQGTTIAAGTVHTAFMAALNGTFATVIASDKLVLA